MLREDDFSRLELNLPNCLSNYRYFRGRLERETKLLVLVKANAYGHGAVEFASMMQQAGADYLAVALPVEGVELRRAGISLPILVLTAGTDFFAEIIENRLEPGIPNLFTLKAFCDFLESRGIKDYPVHIKLDTGMHRLGFVPSEIEPLLDFLKNCKTKRDVADKVDFFHQYICAEPPGVWTDFFRTIEQRCDPLKAPNESYSVYMVDAADTYLISLLTTDTVLKGIVIRAEGYRILIPSSKRSTFVSRLKSFGYLL